MNKTITSFVLSLMLLCSLSTFAQTDSDSCYVYTYLHWLGKGAKYQVRLIQDFGDEGKGFENEAGEPLVFPNFMSALNYAIEKEGWEVFQISNINPFNGLIKREQYAILRKCMQKNESASYRVSEVKAEKNNKKKNH